MAMTKDDFDYAIENTHVIVAPERQIATFGSTSFDFYLIHQLRDQIKIETGAAKSRDLSLRSNDYMRVFNRVIEVVLGHGHRTKLAFRYREFKNKSGHRHVAGIPTPRWRQLFRCFAIRLA